MSKGEKARVTGLEAMFTARSSSSHASGPKTPLRRPLQPTDFTVVDIGETVGPQTYVFGAALLPFALTCLRAGLRMAGKGRFSFL